MEKSDRIQTLKLASHLGELETIREHLKNFILSGEIPTEISFSLTLALEEAFTNIVNYAYADDKEHIVELQFVKQGGKLIIILTDDGQAYDPTTKAEPDIASTARDRPVGGLGIYLVKKVMDKVEYQRVGNKNQLILTKYFLYEN